MITILAAALLLASNTKLAVPATDIDSPHAPYRISENIYSVGTQGIGVYLVETDQGLIVIDSGTKDGVRLVEANIQTLGFKLKDVRYLLETQALRDHVGGMAQLKKDTGAQFIASGGDRYGLENGVHVGENHDGPGTFAPVAVDRVLNDGDAKVKLGGVTLTAVFTPGHTRGDTTWTMDSKIAGKKVRVVFFGSASVAGNVLVGNNAYPHIVEDYQKTFATLKTLKADVLLAGQPEAAGMEAKYQNLQAGKADAFVDPKALPALAAKSESDFYAALTLEQTR
ncbi:subclass B3 metallo-beta-lactamase [Asticcacaulis solisilvae]|uniref:subclass B3 metallo-beta-lactamase n=1 Tax=Asticcacaulis solisilvae TaxID=1217274 RepID=UPI003FD6D9FF